MLTLLSQQQYSIFILIIIALTVSLTFHEYGHAIVAKLFGDNTAEEAGRLTLNPIAHIDPMGMLMVVLIGFGYAKPVPTNPNNYSSPFGTLFVAAAGPAMNLLVAIVTFNFYLFAIQAGWEFASGQGAQYFFTYLALINLLLMLFNLIPIGPLDGHYILPYFLPRKLARPYYFYNQKYGSFALLGLILLNLIGVPIFDNVWKIGQSLLSAIAFI